MGLRISESVRLGRNRVRVSIPLTGKGRTWIGISRRAGRGWVSVSEPVGGRGKRRRQG